VLRSFKKYVRKYLTIFMLLKHVIIFPGEVVSRVRELLSIFTCHDKSDFRLSTCFFQSHYSRHLAKL
jgi:hypothetical protein